MTFGSMRFLSLRSLRLACHHGLAFGVAMALSACGFSARDSEDTRPQAAASLPLKLMLAEDAPRQWGDINNAFDVPAALAAAAAVWNEAAGLKIVSFDGTRVLSGTKDFALDTTSRDGRNTVYVFEQFGDTRVSLGTDSPADILGLCVTRGFESDIALTLMAKLRSDRGRASLGATEAPGELHEVRAADLVEARFLRNAFDFRSVAIHELGHALGLVHDTQDPASVMWHQGLAVGKVNRALSASDKRNLREVLAGRYGIKVEITESTDAEPTRE